MRRMYTGLIGVAVLPTIHHPTPEVSFRYLPITASPIRPQKGPAPTKKSRVPKHTANDDDEEVVEEELASSTPNSPVSRTRKILAGASTPINKTRRKVGAGQN